MSIIKIYDTEGFVKEIEVDYIYYIKLDGKLIWWTDTVRKITK